MPLHDLHEHNNFRKTTMVIKKRQHDVEGGLPPRLREELLPHRLQPQQWITEAPLIFMPMQTWQRCHHHLGSCQRVPWICKSSTFRQHCACSRSPRIYECALHAALELLLRAVGSPCNPSQAGPLKSLSLGATPLTPGSVRRALQGPQRCRSNTKRAQHRGQPSTVWRDGPWPCSVAVWAGTVHARFVAAGKPICDVCHDDCRRAAAGLGQGGLQN
jgi:hypothetical protein